MKSILLHVYDDDCFEARFQVALDLARQCKGRITCAQAVPYDLGMPSDFYGMMSAEMIVEYDKIAEDAKKAIEERLSHEDVQWEWKRSRGSAAALIGSCAPIHDVVIVGSHDPLKLPKSPSRFVGELIERVRAPIIVVPSDVRSFDLEVPAIVAWNSSAESAHALRAAMPLLSRAKEVHVLSVDEKKRAKKHAPHFELPSLRAAEYLAEHGVKSEITELPKTKGRSIADTLVAAAKAREGGYIVMGAYGHSRFREQILGGVTRDMLRGLKLPLVLAH